MFPVLKYAMNLEIFFWNNQLLSLLFTGISKHLMHLTVNKMGDFLSLTAMIFFLWYSSASVMTNLDNTKPPLTASKRLLKFILMSPVLSKINSIFYISMVFPDKGRNNYWLQTSSKEFVICEQYLAFSI